MALIPALEAFIAELDQAVASLQAARRIAAGLSRGATRPHAALGARVALRHSGMTVGEAAALLGIGPEQVRRLLRRGDLNGVAFGGRTGWRLDRDELEKLADRRSGGGRRGP